MKFTYEAGQLAGIGMSLPGGDAEYRFDANGLRYSRDMAGNVSEFVPSRDGPVLARRDGGGEARFSYDRESRLREIVKPDGGKIIYDFKNLRDVEEIESVTVRRTARGKESALAPAVKPGTPLTIFQQLAPRPTASDI